jgi:hypothetical protein
VTFVFSTPERHWETKPSMKMGDFDASIFVFLLEKLHDSKYSKDASPKP